MSNKCKPIVHTLLDLVHVHALVKNICLRKSFHMTLYIKLNHKESHTSPDDNEKSFFVSLKHFKSSTGLSLVGSMHVRLLLFATYVLPEI